MASSGGGEDDASKLDLFHLIKRFGAYVTFKIGDLFSLSFNNLVFLSLSTFFFFSIIDHSIGSDI
jgi:hypothetical protein